jgi:hypothetical protein
MTDAPRRAVLLSARIRLVCLLLAPCAAGASVISVRHLIYEQDHEACRSSMLKRAVMNECGLFGCGIYQPFAVGAYQ